MVEVYGEQWTLLHLPEQGQVRLTIRQDNRWDCSQWDSLASDIVEAMGEVCSGGVLGRRSGQYPGWLSSESSMEPLVAVLMSRTRVRNAALDGVPLQDFFLG